tara:strand:+ start:216 stop:527 length:312 start_codon:yes stop_codon:yes gene_type:complete
MDYQAGYDAGFAAGYAAAMRMSQMAGPVGRDVMFPGAAAAAPVALSPPKKKRKVSAYSRAYGAAYKRLRKKATLKSGKLRKGVTHKRLVKQAHAEAKRRRGKK